MTTVSAQQTIYSFQIVIISILARVFLGNKISTNVGIGMFFITMGILSTILGDQGSQSDTATNPVLGDLFVLLSCFVTAVQNVTEEGMLKN